MQENQINIPCKIEGWDIQPPAGWFPETYPTNAQFQQCVTEEKYKQITEYINNTLQTHLQRGSVTYFTGFVMT